MLAFCEKHKSTIVLLVIFIICWMVASLFSYKIGYRQGYDSGFKAAGENVKASEGITEPAKVQTETKTVIQYVEKELDSSGQQEAADIDANLGKQEITVRVNGQEQKIQKADSEKYIFDQNKLTFDQRSTAALDIKVPTVDNTRRWSAGVGYGNHGLAGKLDFPLGKKNNIGGWVAGDKETVMVGVTINF